VLSLTDYRDKESRCPRSNYASYRPSRKFNDDRLYIHSYLDTVVIISLSSDCWIPEFPFFERLSPLTPRTRLATSSGLSETTYNYLLRSIVFTKQEVKRCCPSHPNQHLNAKWFGTHEDLRHFNNSIDFGLINVQPVKEKSFSPVSHLSARGRKLRD